MANPRNLDKLRAVLTADWGNGIYRPLVTRKIESYYVDTSLDNDSDIWVVEVGDLHGEIAIDAIKRNNEVRVKLFGIGSEPGDTEELVIGVADEIEYGDTRVLKITGRDLSSLATDSVVPPQRFEQIRAWEIVAQQARELGIGGEMNLAKKGIIKKVQYTDGSETYWEFWHRLYRKEKCWIWFTPQGSLIAAPLRYDDNPTYYFGTPDPNDAQQLQSAYIPVSRLEMRKSQQQRFHEIWVYWHKGDNGFVTVVKDPTMSKWLKRPRKIIQDKDAHTENAAKRTAWEEIFEGKVGSVEFRLTIPDPGFMIRQNRIARLRIDEIGLDGEYFVVGVRAQGGPDGFVQEIRLRERQYAISRRVPTDPRQDVSEPPRNPTVTTDLGDEITASGIRWGPFFVAAAQKWHGPWDFKFFLATLIAICDQETGGRFVNVNNLGSPGPDWLEWYAWAPVTSTVAPGLIPQDKFGRTRAQWLALWQNENPTYAVGPMQLYTLSYKHMADDLFRPGYRNQYYGGRWYPEHNIMVAAQVLRLKLQAARADDGNEINMWAGVSLYGHNAHLYKPGQPTPYAISVKNKVYNDPGYLGMIDQILADLREEAQEDQAADEDTDTVYAGTTPAFGLPQNSTEALLWLRSPTYSPRQKVVAAAMYGYFHRAEIHYASQNSPQVVLRDDDFAPPPNVPAWLDCSSFVTWCYKSAGAPDPSGANYSYIGSTYTQIVRGQSLSSPAQLQPGDLVFYGGTAQAPTHVALFVGANQVVSHGLEEGPLIPSGGVAYRPIVAMRSYL